jgi:alkylation response protein AidB-like acyl-CoA dehydrogenase
LAPALFQELRRAGIFNLTVPRAFGGTQVDLTTFVSVIEELSRHDGSVGWNAMIAGSYGFLADYLPEATAKAIFDSGDALVAGTLAPTGQADRMPGGYAISGRWSFARRECARRSCPSTCRKNCGNRWAWKPMPSGSSIPPAPSSQAPG